ncbi:MULTISPECIES: hypothetical protein [unclassified Candidatus Sulfotelmatobacter]|uniref:hypothetical protein n=1 Tax=unclassified Candidatus Sulfotelmatobacter TaxID=2635724 RepID=UPI001CC22AC7|nr:hypothetical protein [Kocuria sp. cx-116]
MTLTQRVADRSRPSSELDRQLTRELGDLTTSAPFQPTGPGEVRGLTEDPEAAVSATMIALRDDRYAVAIGVGEVFLTRVTDPQGRLAVAADGAGMHYGHEAAAIGRSIERVAVRVCAADQQSAAEAQAVLKLVGRIVSVRSEAEWRVVDLLIPGARGQQKDVAAQLGITPQAVSKAVMRSLWHEEWDARPAAATLLQRCAEHF